LGFYVRAEASIFRAEVGDEGTQFYKKPHGQAPKKKKEEASKKNAEGR
jgi:hypothetical protein